MKDIRSLHVEKYLLNNGYKVERRKGDHVIFKKDKNMIVITAPRVNSLVVRNQLRKNNIFLKPHEIKGLKHV